MKKKKSIREEIISKKPENVTEGFVRREKFYGTYEDLKNDILYKLTDSDNWEDVFIIDKKYNLCKLQQLGSAVIDDRYFYLTSFLEDFEGFTVGDYFLFEVLEDRFGNLDLDIIDDIEIGSKVLDIIREEYKKLEETEKANDNKEPKEEEEPKENKETHKNKKTNEKENKDEK